jgi:hypothetical protein
VITLPDADGPMTFTGRCAALVTRGATGIIERAEVDAVRRRTHILLWAHATGSLDAEFGFERSRNEQPRPSDASTVTLG